MITGLVNLDLTKDCGISLYEDTGEKIYFELKIKKFFF